MALPTNDVGWVNWLERRHDAEKPQLEALNSYYEGTQPLTYMHPEIFREVADRIRPVIIAWPQLIVDALEERLDVEGFRLPNKTSSEDDLWRVWQANDLDEESQLGHIDALALRRAYATVGTNEDDDDTPLVSVESPLEMYGDVDPRTRKMRAALRRVAEYDALAGVNERYATLYRPNATVWYRWDGGWREYDRDDHGLGEVPVVPLVNRARLRLANRSTANTEVTYGQSELAPIIPLSDAACKLATDMMIGAEFASLPLRGFWGLSPDDMVDEDGNKLTAIQAIMGRFLTLLNPEGREFQFPPTSLDNFHNSINQLARMVASLAGLPPHYLGFSTDNPASADAIRSAESRLVKRAERKQRAFGGSWERVMRLVRRLQTGEWDPGLARLETVWRNPATPTVAQKADATVKLATAPKPIITIRQARQDLGYTDPQIKKMEREDAAERDRDPLAEIGRALQPPPQPDQRQPDPAMVNGQRG